MATEPVEYFEIRSRDNLATVPGGSRIRAGEFDVSVCHQVSSDWTPGRAVLDHGASNFLAGVLIGAREVLLDVTGS
jgi:hypothetical protein